MPLKSIDGTLRGTALDEFQPHVWKQRKSWGGRGKMAKIMGDG
jgi:hypothetical protein